LGQEFLMYSLGMHRFYMCMVVILYAVLFSFSFQELEKPSKLELQKQLEREFVAPCCWKEAVATHRSPEATEVRTEISNLLDQGKIADEIKNIMVAQYGRRILIKPTTEGFNLLAWTGPFIMLAIGFVIVGVWLFRFRRKRNST